MVSPKIENYAGFESISGMDLMDKMKNNAKKIQDESEAIRKRLDDFEKIQKQQLKKEAENYISKQINDGKIKPAYKDRYVNEYISYKTDEEKFKSFKDDIESRGTIINLAPTDTATNGDVTAFKYEPEKLNYKVGASINYDELENNIQAVMKSKNLSWEDAARECGVLNPKEEVTNGNIS